MIYRTFQPSKEDTSIQVHESRLSLGNHLHGGTSSLLVFSTASILGSCWRFHIYSVANMQTHVYYLSSDYIRDIYTQICIHIHHYIYIFLFTYTHIYHCFCKYTCTCMLFSHIYIYKLASLHMYIIFCIHVCIYTEIYVYIHRTEKSIHRRFLVVQKLLTQLSAAVAT